MTSAAAGIVGIPLAHAAASAPFEIQSWNQSIFVEKVFA